MSSPREADLRRLFDRSPVGMYRSTAEGRFVYVNPALVRMLGYDQAEEVLALLIPEHVYADVGERGPLVDRYLANGVVDGVEVKWKTRHGKILVVRIYGYVVKDSDGTAFEATAVDVTALKEAEQEVQRQKAEAQRGSDTLRMLLEQMPAVIWTTNAELQVTSWQGGGVRSLGLPATFAAATSLVEFFGSGASSFPPVASHRAVLTGATVHFELERDDHVFAVTVAPQRDAEGQVIGTIGTAIDVTAPRRLERRIVDAQRAESLGVMAGSVAHDFNNLLVAMLGNADLALRDLPSGPERSAVENIRIAAIRASQMTGQLLAFSGGGAMGLEDVALRPMIDELIALLGPQLSDHATISVDLAPDLPPVHGDASQLRQVLLNLVTNARDALTQTPGGRIAVRARAVEVNGVSNDDDVLVAQRPGRYVMVTVEDNGGGIEPGARRRIFDPFFSTKVTGHGLGLAAVHGIVRGHGGGIRVKSDPGHGTVFEILLPAGELHARAAASRRANVLVIDDEALVRDVLCRMLEDIGFAAVGVADGNAGLELAKHGEPKIDVAIVDLTMPGKGGREVIAELRQLRPDLPVVLCSGYDRDRVNAQGAAGFLRKPFRFENLEEVLNEVLAR